jgi:hypothetical protein
MDMSTTATLLTRMAEVGVPFEEAHWWHTVGRPRGFREPGDVPRMRNILWKLNGPKQTPARTPRLQ